MLTLAISQFGLVLVLEKPGRTWLQDSKPWAWTILAVVLSVVWYILQNAGRRPPAEFPPKHGFGKANLY